MKWAALVSWMLTAGGGSVLLAAWVRHGGIRQREGIHAARLLTHASLAAGGLLLWIGFLIANNASLAWAAVGVLLVVAAIGAVMFAEWWKGRTRAVHTAVPADASFPLPIVIVHGLLGVTTLILAVLSAAGLP
jgi:hypothetical protein